MSQKDKRTFQKQEKIELPILTHTKTFDHPTLHIDRKANSVYFSIIQEPLRTQLLKQDATHHPIRYDETTAKFIKNLSEKRDFLFIAHFSKYINASSNVSTGTTFIFVLISFAASSASL